MHVCKLKGPQQQIECALFSLAAPSPKDELARNKSAVKFYCIQCNAPFIGSFICCICSRPIAFCRTSRPIHIAVFNVSIPSRDTMLLTTFNMYQYYQSYILYRCTFNGYSYHNVRPLRAFSNPRFRRGLARNILCALIRCEREKKDRRRKENELKKRRKKTGRESAVGACCNSENN